MGWYSRALAKVPYLFIAIDVALAFILGSLTIYYHSLPDFSDPFTGFEPRGTNIRGWMNAGYFLQKEIFDGKLKLAPGFTFKSTGFKLSLSMGGVFPREEADIITNLTDPRNVPRMGVVAVEEGKSLMHADMLRAICHLEYEAIKRPCGDTCNVTSLPDVIADLYGKRCRDLTDGDVDRTIGLLATCSRYYFFNKTLVRDCHEDAPCPGVPADCQRRGAVFRIFNDFTDKRFMEDGHVDDLDLSYTVLFLQWYGNVQSLRQFFTENLGENRVYNDLVQIRGIKLMIPKAVFRWYLVQDLVWFGLAMGVVILLLVIYLRSFILMITVILNVVFSLLLAYFIYFMVVRFTFFPFINILAALLLIALGADDLFIFYDIWRDEKLRNPKASYEELISYILRKGGTSVFVTSFTTTAALMANFVNDVTAIRCFGAFAAICVFVNFLLFITWVPAIFVIIDYAYGACLSDDFCYARGPKTCQRLFDVHDAIWRKVMPTAINRAGPFWIFLSLAMTSGGLVATFWKPRLELPSTNRFRLLVPSHPFEVYERQVQDQLRFEIDEEVRMSLQLLWGVLGADNGDLLNPDAIGSIVVDPAFDIYPETSQTWLSTLCERLLAQEFIDEEFASEAKCYWQHYKEFVSSPCLDRTTCCSSYFPLSSHNLSRQCMAQFSSLAMNGERKGQMVGLPLFDDQDRITAFQMTIKTHYNWTANYEKMKAFYETIEGFMTSELQSAPSGVDNGWFTGAALYEFRFFDLQRSLASGTLLGIAVSMAIGFIVLLFTTLNIFLTFYAIITIGLVIATTTGILALMGWELNTSEALTLTLSMGLSIDFTIHNGVAYKLSGERRRADKITEALSSVGSAITMAGLTTLGAGAAIMCGSVWAYRQFGVFLVLTMLLSWFYAMFFFMSLCTTIGPVGRVGDFSCIFTWMKKCACCAKRAKADERARPPTAHTVVLPSEVSSSTERSFDDRSTASIVRGYGNEGFDRAPEALDDFDEPPPPPPPPRMKPINGRRQVT